MCIFRDGKNIWEKSNYHYILTRSQNDELRYHIVIAKTERMQMLDVENLSLNRVKSKLKKLKLSSMQYLENYTRKHLSPTIYNRKENFIQTIYAIR